MEDDDHPPLEHPHWRPAGQAGHYCISERYCPCGHFNRGRAATTRNDGKRGRITLDAIEDNDDGSR